MTLIPALLLAWLAMCSGGLLLLVSLGRAAAHGDRASDAAVQRLMAEGGALRLAVADHPAQDAAGALCRSCETFIAGLRAGAPCPSCGDVTTALARITPPASRDDAAPSRARGARAV